MFNTFPVLRHAVTTLAVALVVASGGPKLAAHPSAAAARPPAIPNGDILDHFSQMPLAFVENRGQVDAAARYYIRGPRYAFYVTPGGLLLSFSNERSTGGHTLALSFPGSNPAALLSGDRLESGTVNYFHGNDPAAWHTGIPRYEGVSYRGLWPGIDLHVREQGGTLKYQFHLHPGAKVSDIRLAYSGSTHLSIDDGGGLAVGTAHGYAARLASRFVSRDRRPARRSGHPLQDPYGERERRGVRLHGGRRLPARSGARSSTRASTTPRFSAGRATISPPASRSTPPATPTSWARPSRRISRRQPARSAGPALRPMSPTSS